MANGSPFVRARGWKISEWKPTPDPGGIPDLGFQPESMLLIGMEPGDGDTYSLSWLDSANFFCSMSGLRELEPGKLSGKGIAHFGKSSVHCQLKLTFHDDGPDARFVRGIIKSNGADTDTRSGTFVAEANAGPPVDGGAERQGARKAGAAHRRPRPTT